MGLRGEEIKTMYICPKELILTRFSIHVDWLSRKKIIKVFLYFLKLFKIARHFILADRERQTETKTDRNRQRQRQTESNKETERQTETARERDRNRHREAETAERNMRVKTCRQT